MSTDLRQILGYPEHYTPGMVVFCVGPNTHIDPLPSWDYTAYVIESVKDMGAVNPGPGPGGLAPLINLHLRPATPEEETAARAASAQRSDEHTAFLKQARDLGITPSELRERQRA